MSLKERFWAKVNKTDTCWLWTAGKTHAGYGVINVEDSTKCAHRVAYELEVSTIPTGMEVDHLCHNTSCVRPDHLRVVTSKQNSENRRGPQGGTKSGVRGVYRSRDKWAAHVHHNGRAVYGGTFDTIPEAAARAREMRLEMFTHNDADRKAS